MGKLAWDLVGERTYETGVDHGVLYLPNEAGLYLDGVAWNGLVTVTESPSGAEANPQYADNMKYLNLISAEQFAATIEAFTYPDEFQQFDGLAVPVAGVVVGQQARKGFGLCYRTLKGNDLEGDSHGYKLHLVYGCTAAPSEKAYASVNDSPEAIQFSWEVSTIPVAVEGITIGGKPLRPTSVLTIDSTEVAADDLATLELILYGDTAIDPRLPLPAEVIALFQGGVTVSGEPLEPAYDSGTNTITFPAITGVEYLVDGEVQTAPLVITEDTIVTARPAEGYVFPAGSDDDWVIQFT